MSAGFSADGLAAGFTFSAAPHLISGMAGTRLRAVGNCDDQLKCEEEAIRRLRGSGKAPSGREGGMDGMGASEELWNPGEPFSR